MRPRLSYANIASTLALVIAVGGGGAAVAAGLADDSVGSQHIRDNSVRAKDIRPDSIGSQKVRDGSLRGVDLRPGTLTGDLLADGTLTADQLADGTLTGDQMKPGTLPGTLLTAGTLTGDLLAARTLTGDLLADDAVTGRLLADGSVTGAHVADGTLSGAHVADDALTGADIDESTLDLDLPSPNAGPLLVASAPSGQRTFTSGANPMASTVLEAPTAGIAMVTMQAEFNATAGSRYLEVSPTRNGSGIGYYDWEAGDVDGLSDQRQTAFAVTPVSAGTHTFAFTVTENRASGTYSQYYGAQIAVQYFPTADAASRAMSRVPAAPNR